MDSRLRRMLLPSIVGGIFAFVVKSYMAVLSPYLAGLGFSEVFISLAFGFYAFIRIVLSPAIGHLSDRVGRYQIILLGLVAQMIALGLYVIDSSLVTVFAARFLDAVAATAVTLMSLAKIQDIADDGRTGRFTGLGLSIKSVGQIGGSLAGGYIASYWGVTAPFYTGLALTGFLVLVLASRPMELRGQYTRGRVGLLTELRQFLSFTRMQAMAVLGFFMHAKGIAILTFLPLFITKKLGFGYSVVGNALFLFGLMKLLQVIWGRLLDSRRPEPVVIGGVMLTAVAVGLLPFVETALPLYGVVLLHSLGSSLWNTSAWVLMSDVGEQHDIRGSIMGSYVSFAKMGALPAGLINGFVVVSFGYTTLFTLYAGLVLAAAIIAAVLFRQA